MFPLFHAISELPIMLDPARLDEGDGIDKTLRRNHAKYHQSCRTMFNNTKLERAKKRRSTSPSSSAEGRAKIRRTSLASSSKQSECFLCEKVAPTSSLRHAMTMQLNKRVNECATNLNDGKLLAKLSGGDVVATRTEISFCLPDRTVQQGEDS